MTIHVCTPERVGKKKIENFIHREIDIGGISFAFQIIRIPTTSIEVTNKTQKLVISGVPLYLLGMKYPASSIIGGSM